MRLVIEGQNKSDRVGLELRQDGEDVDVFANSDDGSELLISFRLNDNKLAITNYQVYNTRVIAAGDDGKVLIS